MLAMLAVPAICTNYIGYAICPSKVECSKQLNYVLVVLATYISDIY